MIPISLCMIVRNEEANLAACLDSIARFMEEIVIIDTGSSDSTKQIALRYTDQVYDFTWCNDFAAARNYAISKTSKDYILVIDSDEIVESIDLSEINRLIPECPTGIGRLKRINEYTRNGVAYQYNERVNRLFSKQLYHYEGIIHEQLTPTTKEVLTTYSIPLTIRHCGYEGDIQTRRKKTERNINLLIQALKDNPQDPYLLYQLGKSYYMEENYQSACQYFGDALYFDLDPQLEYVQDMVESYGYALLNTEQYEIAMQLLSVYEEFSYSADFVFMIALVLMNNGKFSQAVEEFTKATNYKDCKMQGVNNFLAFYNIGVIYECLGDKNRAIKYFMKCKGYEPALNRLKQIN